MLENTSTFYHDANIVRLVVVYFRYTFHIDHPLQVKYGGVSIAVSHSEKKTLHQWYKYNFKEKESRLKFY